MRKDKWNQLKKQLFGAVEGEVWIDAVCVSHLGKVRERNEDNLYYKGCILPRMHDREKKLKEWRYKTRCLQAVAVFDGMGGENAGDLASFTSAREFQKCCKKLVKKQEMPDEEQITQMLTDVSNTVFQTAKEEHYGLIGSTATVFFMKGNKGILADLGDSPMYQVRNGEMNLISQAHTDAELLKQQGIDRKPALTQFLGINAKEFLIEPYIREVNLKSGDQYLLCSDGLTDMMTDEEIEQILIQKCTISEKLNLLLCTVLERGAKDNTTIILCEVM
ncbi:MAG: protein phosphatase 2C domain-containing protein [Roseburia sp.]|nr:protein phosphatase 2C domain-containing protein [Roseburia sp.]